MPSQNEEEVRSGLRVLLIEDNENILESMPTLLENMGCEVAVASTGKDGITKTATFKPDVVLVDIGLPDITGHEVGIQIRSEGYRGIIVAISGYSHADMRDKSHRAGIDYHLAKLARLTELKQILSNVWRTFIAEISEQKINAFPLIFLIELDLFHELD